MRIGAELVTQTVERIAAGDLQPVEQSPAGEETLCPAPKIFRENCEIDWSETGERIVNLVRGLAPYPAAWTTIRLDGEEIATIKIYEAHFEPGCGYGSCGTICSDGRSFLSVRCRDGAVGIESLQMAGKRRMQAREWLAGFRDPEQYRFGNDPASQRP